MISYETTTATLEKEAVCPICMHEVTPAADIDSEEDVVVIGDEVIHKDCLEGTVNCGNLYRYIKDNDLEVEFVKWLFGKHYVPTEVLNRALGMASYDEMIEFIGDDWEGFYESWKV